MDKSNTIKTEKNLIIIINESEIKKSETFINFAHKYQLRTIFDFRVAPRLDILAGSRIQAFKLFEELQVNYLDIFGRAGIYSTNQKNSLGDVFQESFDRMIEIKKLNLGAIVLFFDDKEILNNYKYCLSSSNISHYEIIFEYKSGLLFSN